MDILTTTIPDVFILEPRIFSDDRGYFCETYNENTFKDLGITANFVQDNQSFSSYGTIRGLHAQTGEHSQAKLVRVLTGAVIDVVVDSRPHSPTYGTHLAVELSSENHRQLFIPRGLLHGFSVISQEATFFYKCDNYYNKESETGVIYNDPTLNIDWKIEKGKEIISDKDMLLQNFPVKK